MKTIPVTVEIKQTRTMFIEVPDKFDYLDLLATVYKNGDVPRNENWVLSDVKIKEEDECF
jgi:hypothetical protein